MNEQAVCKGLGPRLRGEHGGRGKALTHLRVIASAATQPRGLTRIRGDVALGCFGAMRLAMTREGAVLSPPALCLRERGRQEIRPPSALWATCPGGGRSGFVNLPPQGEVPAKPG